MAQLNNSLAYGFVRNIVSNVIIKAFTEKGVKASMVQSTGTFKPIELKVTGIGKVSCLAGNVQDGALALSMYHMMYAKNIGFIYNNNVYILNGDILRANWENIMSCKPSLYTDGVGTKTSMTYAEVSKLVELASSVLPLSETLVKYYAEKQKEYFN